MVTKTVKQPNGKYMEIQTTANMLSWNLIIHRLQKPNYDSWEEFCESVEYNQDFNKVQLEKLIEEFPEEGILEMSNFSYYEHYQYMHHDFPKNPIYDPAQCSDCKKYDKIQEIMFPK